MKKIFTILMFLFLSACATQNPLTDFRFQTQTQPPYVLASWYKIDAPGKILRVYIEGDGNAFNVKGQPTDNPTPNDTFMRDMAAHDPNPNVAYLGRPCQYLQAGACSKTDWTSGRFSEAVVNSMERAVGALMKKARTNQVVLIGYSGGAQIAGLIAVRQPDKVVNVITIGGVLDHRAWTSYHNDSPLEKSMNLADYKKEFEKISQHHYAGDKDQVVPLSLTQEYMNHDTQKITVVPGATHYKGWNGIIKEIYHMN